MASGAAPLSLTTMLYFLSSLVLSLCLFTEPLSALIVPISVGLVSPSCNAVLEGVIINPTASDCLNLPTLVAGLAETSANQSWIPTINTWLTGLCGRPACSKETTQQIVSNLTSGCQQEMQMFNMTELDIASVTTDMTTSSGLERGFICLADNAQNATWCLTDTLRRLERSMGSPLNPQSLLSVIPLLATGGLGGVASNVTCTDCNRATYALARAYSPSVANNTELYDDLVHQCGEAFMGMCTILAKCAY